MLSTASRQLINQSNFRVILTCFHLIDSLAEYSLNLSHCTIINIFLSSIDLFARVNAVYATFFGASPPARACVAVDLPSPIRVKLDCIAFSEHTAADRQALHVQSLSYWAPANIGPYSQAITVRLKSIHDVDLRIDLHNIQVDERVFISGQIGLIPSSLSLPSPQSLAFETALCFQHVERVVDALRTSSGGGWTGHCQSAIYWAANAEDIPRIRAAHVTHEQVNYSLFFTSKSSSAIDSIPISHHQPSSSRSNLYQKMLLQKSRLCSILVDTWWPMKMTTNQHCSIKNTNISLVQIEFGLLTKSYR